MSWMTEASTLIPAACTGISAIILAMGKVQLDKVKDQAEEIAKLEGRVATLEEQQAKDRSLFREAGRFIRAQFTYIGQLIGLLAKHAPDVPVPPAPELPKALSDEI